MWRHSLFNSAHKLWLIHMYVCACRCSACVRFNYTDCIPVTHAIASLPSTGTASLQVCLKTWKWLVCYESNYSPDLVWGRSTIRRYPLCTSPTTLFCPLLLAVWNGDHTQCMLRVGSLGMPSWWVFGTLPPLVLWQGCGNDYSCISVPSFQPAY